MNKIEELLERVRDLTEDQTYSPSNEKDAVQLLKRLKVKFDDKVETNGTFDYYLGRVPVAEYVASTGKLTVFDVKDQGDTELKDMADLYNREGIVNALDRVIPKVIIDKKAKKLVIAAKKVIPALTDILDKL